MMKAFSFKEYKVLPFTDNYELKQALQKESMLMVPNWIFSEISNDGSKTCCFLVFNKESGEFTMFASFVFDTNEKKLVHSKFISSLDDEKKLERLVTKTTDYVYNKVGGIYFQINSDEVDEKIVSAAIKAGYKKKKDADTLYLLDKNTEIGIISLIASI